MKSLVLLLVFISLPMFFYAQSDLDKVLKGGEILVNGLSFFSGGKSESKSSNSKTIESLCIKNKLSEKIVFRITGTNEEGDEVKKEMVIQKDGKECVFEVPKGIYTYEIVLANKEIFKKGEYKFTDDITITVKEE